MNFTFGIITDGKNDDKINTIIDSIEKQNIPEYEIIIVGNSNINRKNTTINLFDETVKNMWITRKKNIITQKSNFNNVVYMHDYIKLEDDWYGGFLKYGEDFKACMTKMVNVDGSRYRDWTLTQFDNTKFGLRPYECLLPYNIKHLSKHMYFSGAYWVAKKDVMLEFPLDETRGWSDGEDVDWSFKFRNKYIFNINEFSTVRLLKHKLPIYTEISSERAKTL